MSEHDAINEAINVLDTTMTEIKREIIATFNKEPQDSCLTYQQYAAFLHDLNYKLINARNTLVKSHDYGIYPES